MVLRTPVALSAQALTPRVLCCLLLFVPVAPSVMAAPAFAKFSFGAGLVAPQPGLGAEQGALAVPSAPESEAVIGPAVNLETVIKEAKVPTELIQAILTHLKADADTCWSTWLVSQTRTSVRLRRRSSTKEGLCRASTKARSSTSSQSSAVPWRCQPHGRCRHHPSPR